MTYTRDGRSMLERMEAQESYLAFGDPEITAASQRAHRLTEAYNATSVDEPDRRRELLEQLVGRLGAGVTIRPPFQVDFGSYLDIGDGVFANFGLVALDVAPIVIGAACQIGPNVQLLTPTHPIEPQPRRDGWEAAEPITIGENVWLGGGAIVCPGVTIGSDSVIGAGAVVTRDIEPGVVAVGNPARVIRRVV